LLVLAAHNNVYYHHPWPGCSSWATAAATPAACHI